MDKNGPLNNLNKKPITIAFDAVDKKAVILILANLLGDAVIHPWGVTVSPPTYFRMETICH